MELNKEEKIQIIDNRIKNILRENYNQELNLLMYESYGERADTIEATKQNIAKQESALTVLEGERTKVTSEEV